MTPRTAHRPDPRLERRELPLAAFHAAWLVEPMPMGMPCPGAAPPARSPRS